MVIVDPVDRSDAPKGVDLLSLDWASLGAVTGAVVIVGTAIAAADADAGGQRCRSAPPRSQP